MPYIKTWEKEIDRLRTQETKARKAGGEARLQQQRELGILTARERIDYILDDGIFVELNLM